MRRLRPDALIKDLLRNLGFIYTANAVMAVCGLATLALSAQALGAVGVGVIALIETYARSVDQVVRFEPSQAIIRFGIKHFQGDDEDALARLTKFGVLVDMGGAALSAIVAFGLLDVAARWLGFTPEVVGLAQLYLVSQVFGLSATPLALLRLLSKFGVYSRFLIGVALLRLTFIAILWLAGAGLKAFVVTLAVYVVIENLIPLVLAWRALGPERVRRILRVPLKGVRAENPRLLRFILNANVNVLARNSTRQFDTLLIGGLVSTADVGLYTVAKRIGLAALRFSRPIQLVIYPTLARLWTQGEARRFVRVVLAIDGGMAFVGLAASIVVHLYADTLLATAFGPEFVAAADLVLLQIIAIAIFLGGVCLNAALLAAGRDRGLVLTTLGAAALFFAALVPAVATFGVIGASVMHVVFSTVTLIGGHLILFDVVRHHRRDTAPGAPAEQTTSRPPVEFPPD